MLGILGIILGLVAIIYFACKNFNLILFTPIIVIFIALLNGMDLLSTVTTTYMGGVSLLMSAMLFVFILGMVFGEIYQKSGAALSISNSIYNVITKNKRQNASAGEVIKLSPAVGIAVIYVVCVALSYGGLNAAVIVFVTGPIVLDIFHKCDLPNEMIPGTVMGAIVAGTPSLPGTASDQNIIAGTFLGTDAMVEPLVGFICGFTIILLNYFFCVYVGKKKLAQGITFTESSVDDSAVTNSKGPHWFIALIPMILIFVLFNVVKANIIVSLGGGVLLALILFWKHLGGANAVLRFLGEATIQGTVICMIGSSLTGFGSVIAATPVFPSICAGLVGIGLPPMFKAAISIMLITGVGGSAPAGLSIALPTLSATFAEMGISMSSLHRIAVFASQTLDTLPTNPALVINNAAAKTTMEKSYKYLFITTVCTTTLGTLLAALLFTIMG